MRWNHFNPAITTNQTFQEYKKERKKERKKTETGEIGKGKLNRNGSERERKECVAAEFVFAEFLPRHRGVGGPFAKDFSGRGRSGRIRLDINLLLETGWVASVYAHTHTITHTFIETFMKLSTSIRKNLKLFLFLFVCFFKQIINQIPFHVGRSARTISPPPKSNIK